jgi:hypothetical protein
MTSGAPDPHEERIPKLPVLRSYLDAWHGCEVS